MLFVRPTFAAAGTLPTESCLVPGLVECGVDPALPRVQPLPDQQEVVAQLEARSLYAAPFPFDTGLDQLQVSEYWASVNPALGHVSKTPLVNTIQLTCCCEGMIRRGLFCVATGAVATPGC